MPVTYKQAVKLAVEALERWMKELNVNANLYEVYGMDNPMGRNASKKRKKLREAIEVLRGNKERLL